MIVVMKQGATQEEIDGVSKRVKEAGLRTSVVTGAERTIVGIIGGAVSPDLGSSLERLPGVTQVLRVSRPYKLASREFHPDDTVVKIGDAYIGGEHPVMVMAGPCSVETEKQVVEVAKAVKAAGAKVLRGGAFKPRTSPYSFRGLKLDGLKLLAKAREETGLPVITEVLDTRDVEVVHKYSDVLQVGARNMQNFNLLDEVGKQHKPVLLKRGLSATIEEWLLAAEYVLAQGNHNVILCERGIRTFETYTRNTLDLSAIPVVRKLSHLPVVSDPSHGTGKWYLVPPMAAASVAAGAHGLIIEVHPNPDQAKSDGAQSLTPENFAYLMEQVRAISKVQGLSRKPLTAAKA